MRDRFFQNRNGTTYNLIPLELAEAETLNGFKVRNDRHMKSDTWERSV